MQLIRALAVVLFAGSLITPAAAQWITFDASSDGTAVQSGEDASGRSASPVRGFLSLPVEPGRHPAVVLLPSCEGRRPFHQTWAQALAERGYAALVVDDFFMLDRSRTCGLTDPVARAEALERRVQNALGAARYLAARAEVDAGRMAVMGWGDAPVDVLIGANGEVFAAAVAMIPTRCFEDDPPVRPMLVLRSEKGANGSGEVCGAPAATSSLEVKTYAGTLPGFDDPRAESASRRYDRLAHIRAIDDVTGFLNQKLASLPSDGAHEYAPSPKAVVHATGTWAVDPNEPGPDLPPVGGSAFDAVFSRKTPEGVVHDIPFPFSKLLERLERAAGAARMARSPLDSTLIPLGRSLQREAAAPDYFKSPRIVVAVTGEPDDGFGPLGVRLKNRLFLGYQPRSDVLEIISYNEAAARFEFQVVRDYGPGRALSARYARRALCTSCHQNAAPIFADASWGETTANAQVLRRLRGLGQVFHGVPVTDGDRAAVALDIAADEASLLPVYQRLWSEGCASPDRGEVARCRAGALEAMVQYRLSNAAGFDRESPLYAGGYRPVQMRNWRARWPEGLLIPNSNLPDRAPLMSPSPSVVPAALDPLRPRPPLARWEASSTRDLERLVRGLSHSLPDRHIALLDRYLREAGEGAAGRELTAECEVIRRGFSGRPRLFQIECGAGSGANGEFSLQAEVHVTPEGTAQGEAALSIDGATYARRSVKGRLTAASRVVLRVFERDGATPIRAPDGNTVKDVVIAWDGNMAETETRIHAAGRLALDADFRPVAAAIARLTGNATPGSPLLMDRFDGARLSGWLLSELGVLSDFSCCAQPLIPQPRRDIDSPATDVALSVELEHRGPLQTFSRYCGACHGGETLYPPGFMHGDGEEILKAVTQCAERIYYRLSMWQREPDEQAVPPMPPPQGLSLARTTAEEWRRSESLERLTNYARDLIADAGRNPDALLAGRYHATRACLAAPR